MINFLTGSEIIHLSKIVAHSSMLLTANNRRDFLMISDLGEYLTEFQLDRSARDFTFSIVRTLSKEYRYVDNSRKSALGIFLEFFIEMEYHSLSSKDKQFLQDIIEKINSNSLLWEKSTSVVNAKVVLIGESGVGKSGLAIRIAEKIFRETKSTHGAQFWQVSLPENTFTVNNLDNVLVELTLWDLAGQPDYHLVHQLFLNDLDVALLLFDCSDATDPFRGVPYWAKVLKKQTPKRALKYLISSRCDVSPVTVDQREINSKLVEYELDDYFRTCAFTGEGVEELLQHILNNIPWAKLPRTSTPKLFQIIREYLLKQKEAGKTLLSLDEIKTEVNQLYTEGIVNNEEIETVINLLQAKGFIYFLEPTPNLPLVLLRPELINKYASSIIQAARQEGVGAILERDVVCANLSFAGFELGERLPAAEEKLVLESTIELFIRRNLGFRELGRLIFPSQLNIRQEIPADKHPPTEVTYEFSGSIEAIYASLVVCLSYTKDFEREELWKYAAEFSREGHHLGFAMQQAEGTGELEIYFYDQVTDFDRVTFIRFIQDHLYKQGVDLKERIRLYCPECGEEVKNRKAIEKRVKAGILQIPCQYCDASVLIPRSIEEKYRSDRAYIEKQQELQATIKERTRQEVIAFREDREQYMSETDKQIRILHLSDIHLGTSDQANNYFSQLYTDLKQNLKVKQLNYLVLSGDIANYSTVEEYDAAFELVDKLVNRYGLNPDRVITVPGNHDLNWDLSKKSYDFVYKNEIPKSLPEGQYIHAGEAGALIRDEERYQQRFKHFSDRFYKKVYSKPYPLEYDQQAILHPCPNDKILFLALNSCWELDHHYKDRASIKSEAISHAIDQILTGNYDDWLKIAVWHHPVTSAESMKNVAFLEQLAVNGFQVAMHGHIHQAKNEYFKYDTDRGLNIIGAGTFGAPAKEQVTGIPLQYNLLVLNPDNGELTVETRKKEKVDGAWSADARWGDKENPVKNYTITLNFNSVKKKSDNVTSQANNASTENSPDKPNNPQQSIFSNVSVGGNMTVGNINQIYNSRTVPQPIPTTQNSPSQRTILVLAASSTDMPGLRLDKEIREIDEGLRLAKKRDNFKLEQRLAARTEDLRRALLRYEPQIVHFCGHGETDGIFLENDAGTKQLVPKEALTNLFKLFSKRGVQCVVLNACYSDEQAEEISEHINFVVGMSKVVGDKAAIQFAVGFYDALGAGWSYEDAYELGCNAIALEGIPEELTPVLKKKFINKVHKPNLFNEMGQYRNFKKTILRFYETYNSLVDIQTQNEDPLRTKIKHIEDFKYTLVIVGEVSSGKSTLINALLGEMLLPTHALQNTISTIEITRNHEKVIKVTYANDEDERILGDIVKDLLLEIAAIKEEYRKIPYWKLNQFLISNKGKYNDQELENFLNELNNPKINRNRDLILEYLKDYKNLDRIPIKIQLLYPIDEKFDNITIVDTPGVNAVGNFDEITDRYLYDSSDAIIFTQPIQKVENKSLKEFIERQIRNKKSKNLFLVLTQAANLNELDLEDALDIVKDLYDEIIKPENIIHTDSMLKIISDDLEIFSSVEDLKNEIRKKIKILKISINNEQNEFKGEYDFYDKKMKLLSWLPSPDMLSDNESELEVVSDINIFKQKILEKSNFIALKRLLSQLSAHAPFYQLTEAIKIMKINLEQQKEDYNNRINSNEAKINDLTELCPEQLKKLEKNIIEFKSTSMYLLDELKQEYVTENKFWQQSLFPAYKDFDRSTKRIRNEEQARQKLELLNNKLEDLRNKLNNNINFSFDKINRKFIDFQSTENFNDNSLFSSIIIPSPPNFKFMNSVERIEPIMERNLIHMIVPVGFYDQKVGDKIIFDRKYIFDTIKVYNKEVNKVLQSCFDHFILEIEKYFDENNQLLSDLEKKQQIRESLIIENQKFKQKVEDINQELKNYVSTSNKLKAYTS